MPEIVLRWLFGFIKGIIPKDGLKTGRKRVLGIMASILAAQKLAQYDPVRRVPATMCAISDAVRWAEEIMKEIDERWPQEGLRDRTIPLCRALKIKPSKRGFPMKAKTRAPSAQKHQEMS